MDLASLLMAGVSLVAHAIETVLGFGGTVIALALGVHLIPLERLLVALVLLSFLQSAWLVARRFRHIRWQVLLGRILPIAGAGMALGIWCSRFLAGGSLKLILGGFVVTLAATELAWLWRGAPPTSQLPGALGAPLLVAGGFFHGLFASGGPLIVYYASRRLTDPLQFRATLSSLWLLLNAVMLASFFLQGRVIPSSLFLAALLLPSLALGTVVGHLVPVRPKPFRAMTYSILLLSGAMLLIR